MATIVKNFFGDDVDYESIVPYMDKELTEQLHEKFAPCSDQKFFEEYAKAHFKKFKEEFVPYVGGEW